MKKIALTAMALVLVIGLAVPMAAGASPALGLVGLWHFDGDADDYSGNNNDGTVSGAQYVPGKFGQALSFDGTDDYVDVPDSPSLDIEQDLSIEAWVKFDSFTYPHSYVVGKDTNGERSYGIAVDGGHYGTSYIGRVGFIVFKSGGVPSIVWGDTNLTTDCWYHIVGTYDYEGDGTAIMRVYVDGNLDSTENPNAVEPIYAGSADLQIGARQYASPWRCFVDGSIDEVRIWNVALTADEVAYSYSLGDVAIDIKPGSDPNSINRGSNGVIPVAILTTETFDAANVDPSSVSLEGADVKVRGKADKLMAHMEDVDGDGDLDLVVQVVNDTGLSEGASLATLIGHTYDGLAFSGTDSIRVVP